MIRRIGDVLEMIKFSHTIFALPFALIAACLAAVRVGGWRPLDFVGVIGCMVFARSAAMGFNRWADATIDGENPRTASRAIPAGKLSATFVLGFTVVCGALFVAATGLFWISRSNPLPLVLSIPVLVALFGYSYAKRFTSSAHVWLGVALGLAPICAYVAIKPSFDPTPFLLGAAVVAWVAGFDVLYACQDFEFDRSKGLHSVPARFGVKRAMGLARLAHLVAFALLGLTAYMTAEFRPLFPIAVGVAAGLVVYEHLLVRNENLAKINIAFFNVNAAISVTLLAGALFDLYATTRG